jgi:hypothetical protein
MVSLLNIPMMRNIMDRKIEGTVSRNGSEKKIRSPAIIKLRLARLINNIPVVEQLRSVQT